MEKATKISPFRLSTLLRLETNPQIALQLFRNPTPTPNPSRPFRRSARSYDLIVCKLGKARMFAEMENVLHEMNRETRFAAKEALFCRVISFYGRTRMPAAARRTFDRIPSFRCRRTIRSFNSLLHVTLGCGDLEGVRSMCRDLDDYGLTPDACTYNVLIRAQVLAGCIEGAWELFDEMRSKGIAPTVSTFGTLVSALCANSMLDEAFRLKETMLTEYKVKPNAYIYTPLIKGLCKSGELDLALQLKEEMLSDKDLVMDSAVYSTLIRALFRVNRKGEVVGILEEMKRIGIKPDVVTYNAMISGFCEDEKDFDAAFETLNEMVRQRCKPDVVSYNTIIAGLCKAGRWSDASELFDDLPRRECCPDVVSHRILFEGLCDAGEFRKARMVLDEMMFKGYKLGAVNMRKLLEGLLSGEKDRILVDSTLFSVAKANGMGLEDWETVVGNIVTEPEKLKVAKLLACLSMRSVVATGTKSAAALVAHNN
ncbi:putative pentatricopeptide repeat-containing protein At1g53330 [Musa acuminata AAA Group]|uniref:putative pentatricopeptide repeat-containing protein At1g53330 n=1 Tax=Musa acuminata AAA Group TaxID=214697 RepID=UPI0031E1BE70